jgi:hypothetical protein
LTRWDAQLMQDAINLMVEKTAGTDYEAVVANVAANWEAVKADLMVRVAGVELIRFQAAIIQDGLAAIAGTEASRVAPDCPTMTFTRSS